MVFKGFLRFLRISYGFLRVSLGFQGFFKRFCCGEERKG